ncbi:Smr/MutS family protein [Wolbachia endosymbiont of Folsomia candida]|uniref:Smr/MutS family protein n=1 Tax=Wolbachia endosymbiont of Folsomia candida TaxID=169402 RepID=UPI000B110A2F|nr:Smr/MutS family protein [Wolbachia endosymbiont of Folsomia candida]APR98234.1 DNA mismatch repair protein MutS [Wolbachia endosymbiont of Folsomia candida]
MQDDELNWQKNVKPLKCGKVTLKIDHKINIKSVVNKGTFALEENFFNTSNASMQSCLDYNTKSKIDKGKYFISDRLDLHGYNVEDAYYKLIDFVIKNYQAGNRCLLVITGYGNVTNKTGAIKNNLYKWLNDTKIQHMVLYHQQATKEHGGKGAFYVLLRRNRDQLEPTI